MQFVGDAVMAVFGAPVASEDHADRAVAAAVAMHPAQHELNERVGAQRSAGLRARHRALDRAGRSGSAGVRGAPRVHRRRRHRQPDPTPPAVGRTGRDRAERTDLGGDRNQTRRRPARTGDGQRSRHRRRRLPVSAEAGSMTGIRIEVTSGARRGSGRWFVVASVGLSLFGAAVLGELWGWSGLFRTRRLLRGARHRVRNIDLAPDQGTTRQRSRLGGHVVRVVFVVVHRQPRDRSAPDSEHLPGSDARRAAAN